MGPRQLSAKFEDWKRPPGWDRSRVRYSFMIENDDSANFIPLTVQITNHHGHCGPHPPLPSVPRLPRLVHDSCHASFSTYLPCHLTTL